MSASRLGFAATAAEIAGRVKPQLVAVIPPNDHTAYSDFPPIARAIEEAREQRETKVKPDIFAAVYVVPDRDIHDEVLELLGRDVQIFIECRVSLPILVLHIRDIGKFFDIEVSVVDNKGKLRHILLSNRITTLRVSEDTCSIPLQLVPTWNHIPVNLPNIVQAAFKTDYLETTCLVVHSSLRISHIYFEDKDYSDSQLPIFLRTIKSHAP